MVAGHCILAKLAFLVFLDKLADVYETESEKGEKLVLVDPKPGDLSMSRLKLP